MMKDPKFNFFYRGQGLITFKSINVCNSRGKDVVKAIC